MNFHEAKNEIAIKYGYGGWKLGENAMLTHISNEALINERLDEAAELYAQSKWAEACEAQRAIQQDVVCRYAVLGWPVALEGVKALITELDNAPTAPYKP